jgi:hypothetical protein
MNVRLVSAVFFVFAVAASAQDAPSAPSSPQQPAQNPGGWQGGEGQRGGGRGAWGGAGMMGGGRGLAGTVTAVAADHYTVKTDAGETYTIYYSANTRILKQAAGGGGMRQRGEGGQGVGQRAEIRQGEPPQPLKPTDIKVGDAIAVMGEIDATAKSVGAVTILQIDPERARQMREMQANYGKTWLMGKVTAIDGVKVTLMGAIDNASHTFVADENTTFRKRREPITLADIQVGDNLRAEGALKDGAFIATAVNVMGMPPGGTPTLPRNGPPPSQPR